MTPEDRHELISLIRERALQFGDFTLTSGKKSTYYLDAKQITLHARGLELVSHGLLSLMTDEVAVGGMCIGADPIVGGMCVAAASESPDLIGFLVRKEAKGHGTNKYVEGPVKPGDRVMIVEDVITTGKSSLLAVDRVIEFGCSVSKVVGIVDRQEGAAERFAARDLPLESLLTIQDFGIEPAG